MSIKRINLHRENANFEIDRHDRHGRDGHIREGGFFRGLFGRNITMDDGTKFNKGSLIDFLYSASEHGVIEIDPKITLKKWSFSKSKSNNDNIREAYTQFVKAKRV